MKRQTVTAEQAAAVERYLKDQPRYGHGLKRGTTSRYYDDSRQHYLWQEDNQMHSWHDFCMRWGTNAEPYYITSDRPHLIMPGELFLCDAVLGQLWIVRLTNNGKLTKLHCVSRDMLKDFGNSFNGYARVPLEEIAA